MTKHYMRLRNRRIVSVLQFLPLLLCTRRYDLKAILTGVFIEKKYVHMYIPVRVP